MISFTKVSKNYNPGLFRPRVLGVKDLSLDILKGEVFGLVGPNGAGKSTTIKLLLGLIRPDSGSITYNDLLLNSFEFRYHIGYLPENPYLYDHLSLKELLRLGGKSSGMTSKEINERGEALIERMGLTDVGRRPIRTFSKGMLQKAAICFTLLHDPSTVILDEPMSGLDPVGRKLVFDLILELKNRGRTIFFCSHILSDVERLCDRIGFMNRGRLARVVDPSASEKDNILIVIPEAPLSLQEEVKAAGSDCFQNGQEVFVVTNSRNIGEITALIQRHKIGIQDIRREEFSLEDLFLEIVGEERHVA